MKSLFHPPSVLFGCDHVCIIETAKDKEHGSIIDVVSKPSIKMFIPLEMPFAHEPVAPATSKHADIV